MRNLKDDGASTFDQFRSPNSVEIIPEGGITQKYMETETYNEGEDLCLNDLRRWAPELYERKRFNLQNDSGGSTYVSGRKLGPADAHPESDEMPGGPDEPRR